MRRKSLRIGLVCLKAVEAQHRSAALGLGARLKGDLASGATFGTGCGEHLPCGQTLLLALVAAVLATLRCGKSALCVEGLFTFGEGEGVTAIAAG